jgi:TatD DNase family protein
LRSTLRDVPIGRLLTETDSPFLAPVPLRGKRNEPANVARVVAQLAELHGVAARVMAERTSANFHALFRP